MKYKFISWILIGLSMLLFINVIRSFSLLSLRGKIIKDIQNNLQEEKEKQEDLKRQLARVESDLYIENEARNKLNLGREGEMILILPTISPFFQPTPTPEDNRACWQKWLNLYL